MPSFCTIFLPVRNGGSYVAKAVGSICSQSIDDWRLVVLENASTDDTIRTVAEFDDPRITIVPADRPLSMFDNWDRGRALLAAGECDSRFATFIGHDDWLYPDFLLQMQDLVERNPDASLYQAGFDLVDARGDLIRPCRPVPHREDWQDLAAAICWGIRDSFGTGYMFRPDDYLAVGGIPDLPMLLASDDLLFIRLTALRYKATVSTPLCGYRLHRGSTSGGISVRRVEAHIDALSLFVETMEAEFDFSGTPEGRSALACLIARELRPYDSRSVTRRVPAECRKRLHALLARQMQLAPEVDTARWLGTNVVTGELYGSIRRLFIAASLWRHRK